MKATIVYQSESLDGRVRWGVLVADDPGTGPDYSQHPDMPKSWMNKQVPTNEVIRIRHAISIARNIEKAAWHDDLPEFLGMLAHELLAIAGEYWMPLGDGTYGQPHFPKELAEGAKRFQQVIAEAAKDWR